MAQRNDICDGPAEIQRTALKISHGRMDRSQTLRDRRAQSAAFWLWCKGIHALDDRDRHRIIRRPYYGDGNPDCYGTGQGNVESAGRAFGWCPAVHRRIAEVLPFDGYYERRPLRPGSKIRKVGSGRTILAHRGRLG